MDLESGDGLPKRIGGEETSTLDNVVDFLENRENEDIGSTVIYVLQSVGSIKYNQPLDLY